MAEKNRFGNLMSGLNASGADEKADKPKTKKRRTAKAKKKASTDGGSSPTRRDEKEPKIARNRHPGREVGLAKSKNPDYEKGTYYLPRDLTHNMRVYAVHRKMEMSELVAKALQSYLKERLPELGSGEHLPADSPYHLRDLD